MLKLTEIEWENGKRYRVVGTQYTVQVDAGWLEILDPVENLALHNIFTYEQMVNKLEFEPTPNWADVPIDTPVLVAGHEGEEWIRRYFAGVNVMGEPMFFKEGRTSWTNNGAPPQPWKYMKITDDGRR